MDVIGPTFEIFGNKLSQTTTAAAIRSVKRQTFRYGSHDRHVLDLYTPSTTAATPPSPILFFIYGGGFVTGKRVLSEFDDDLVYCNLGYFMAEKLGYETVIIDYSLLEHGATFPSGAQEIEAALQWVRTNLAPRSLGASTRDLYLLGNSAGGVNLASWLFLDEFARSVTSLTRAEEGLHLRVVAILSSAYVWTPEAGMKDILVQYYGSVTASEELSPLPLMQRAKKATDRAWPHVLVMVSELDPQFVIESSQDFMREWRQVGGSGEYWKLAGHNHISPPLALGCGDADAEAWGYEFGERLAGQGKKA